MKTLDMTGRPCPLPVIEAKKALKASAPGEKLAVVVDDDIARQNLQKMAAGLGHAASFQTLPDGRLEVLFEVGSPPKTERRLEEDDGRGLVVAIGRETLGSGRDESLGAALMKSFVHSLTELNQPPESLLFFNGGAFLTTEGSGCLDDLAVLADKGAVVATCGACLNFYQLADKLKIGAVTNMYAIVMTLAQAKKLINV
ncbi:MAG: sulfurtransferase-like selenium metabolism protein YedF [Deltaproteobacteria bacterium]|nr:sulfurtransferase-like selenium metabolism protein YedF [Deltaproteobacteria bacterium]